jgi:putative transposase
VSDAHASISGVKLVAQVKLLPDPAQAAALRATLALANQAANLASRVAWKRRCFNNYTLRKHTYAQVKALGLSAQPAQHAIKKAADAYKAGKANRKACRVFHPEAAHPFDDRCLSWQHDAQTVSIWTVHGRLKGVRFTCGQHQRALLTCRKGESDLVYRDGGWYLYATCELPEPPRVAPNGFVGVDLGIVNIATTSDGTWHAGQHLNRVRHRHRRLRGKLQSIGTKSAKRRLRRRGRKETRFATDTNHCIAKRIVAEAQRTGRGIALEDLTGLRSRVRLRRPQRATLHTWAFRQLGDFIAYKARGAGVVVVYVDPAYTSQTCAECGYVDKANRAGQALFCCRSCSVAAHADHNAARNIAARGQAGWAAVNQPNADTPVAASDAA